MPPGDATRTLSRVGPPPAPATLPTASAEAAARGRAEMAFGCVNDISTDSPYAATDTAAAALTHVTAAGTAC